MRFTQLSGGARCTERLGERCSESTRRGCRVSLGAGCTVITQSGAVHGDHRGWGCTKSTRRNGRCTVSIWRAPPAPRQGPAEPRESRILPPWGWVGEVAHARKGPAEPQPAPPFPGAYLISTKSGSRPTTPARPEAARGCPLVATSRRSAVALTQPLVLLVRARTQQTG